MTPKYEGFLRRGEIIQKYGTSFYNLCYRMKDSLRTEMANSKLFLFSEEDICKLYDGEIKPKCRDCGSTENLYRDYLICNKCRNPKVSKHSIGTKQTQELIQKRVKKTKETLLKKSKEIFLKQVEVLNNNNKVISTFQDYLNRLPYKLVCSCGEEYYKYFQNYSGCCDGCSKCFPKLNRITQEIFIEKSKGNYNGEHDYSKSVFKTVSDDIIVIDKELGEYSVNAGRHMYGSGHHPKRCIGGKSKEEYSLYSYIKSIYCGEILQNKRVLKDEKGNKEIDIYLPELSIGVEYNGLFFHSEYNTLYKTFNHKNQHLHKLQLAKKQNIKLIQITSEQWKNKKDIVKDIIKRNIIKQEQIYARKCGVREVPLKIARQFCEENHIQGYANSKVKIGLYYDNTLVSLMTFGRPRMSKKYDWELIRLCTKLGVSVIGGASRMFKNFRNNYKGNIISYCDLSLFTGEVYEKLGFTYSHSSTPNYHYITPSGEVLPRQMFQKHKLKNILINYNSNASEWENMFENGYNRYWDCGNAVYIIQSIV